MFMMDFCVHIAGSEGKRRELIRAGGKRKGKEVKMLDIATRAAR
jgi:hypothetical protein